MNSYDLNTLIWLTDFALRFSKIMNMSYPKAMDWAKSCIENNPDALDHSVQVAIDDEIDCLRDECDPAHYPAEISTAPMR